MLELINTFDTFSLFFGRKFNKRKFEIAVIGVKKGVKVVLFEMDCFDLKGDTIKILGICFSRNKKVEQKKNFLSQIVTIQIAFKL